MPAAALDLLRPLNEVFPDPDTDMSLTIIAMCLGRQSPALAHLSIAALNGLDNDSLTALSQYCILTSPNWDGQQKLPSYLLNKQELLKFSGLPEDDRYLTHHYVMKTILLFLRILFCEHSLHYQNILLLPADEGDLSFVVVALTHFDPAEYPVGYSVGKSPMQATPIRLHPDAESIVEHLVHPLRAGATFHDVMNTLDEQIPGLYDALLERHAWNPEDESFYYSFFIPLLQTCIQVLSHIKEKVNDEESLGRVESLYDQLSIVFDEVSHQSMIATPTNRIAESPIYEVTIPDMEWSDSRVQQTLEWMRQIFSPKNWRGDPPFYIHLQDTHPLAPKLSVRLGESMRVVTEFGSTLVIPQEPTAEQTRQIWNDLSVWYDEQETDGSNTTVAWEYKRTVFQLLLEQIKFSAEHHHLDLCCGPGNMRRVIDERVQVSGIDISPRMVERARQKGMDALVSDLNEEPIPHDSNSVDSVTISFAEMWLRHERVFTEVWRVLKPGGTFVFNVYTPAPGWEQVYTEKLRAAGFADITCETATKVVSTDEQQFISGSASEVTIYVVSAKK